MKDSARILAVSIGPKALLGTRRGREVYSGIRKAQVATKSVRLTRNGIVGDCQADERVVSGKRVHGGPLKAVYVYPWEHYELWASELGWEFPLGGDFGENLTIRGLLEHDVVIGEQWLWGNALLEVTGPRRPCYKLDMLRGENTAKRMMATGRCGWYLKVHRVAEAPTSGQIKVRYRPRNGLTVAEAFRNKIRTDPTVPDMPEN